MKTENVYLGRIYEVDSIDTYYLMNHVNLNFKKNAVMVLRKNVFGREYMQDLENGQRYRMKLSNRRGTLYVSQSYLEEFNYATRNQEKNLPKEKILELGKRYFNM